MNSVTGKFSNLPSTAWVMGYDELHIDVERPSGLSGVAAINCRIVQKMLPELTHTAASSPGQTKRCISTLNALRGSCHQLSNSTTKRCISTLNALRGSCHQLSNSTKNAPGVDAHGCLFTWSNKTLHIDVERPPG